MSRIEREAVSPSLSTLANLLAALGEDLELTAAPAATDFDPVHLAAHLERTPAERLELAINWNRLAGEIARAGKAARTAGEARRG